MIRETLYVLSLLLLSGCVTSTGSGPIAKECDVSWIEDSQLSEQKACQLRALAKRCALSDQCLIQCESRAKTRVLNVGGGCDHVCEGGGAAQTAKDAAANGGYYWTAESNACFSKSR